MGDALFLYADSDRELNTSFFRIAIPGKYLAKAGHKIDSQHVEHFDVSAVPPVVLMERLIFPQTIDLLRMAGADKIVATFDDAYHILPDTAGSKEFWNRDRLNAFREGLSMCDLVLVPSNILKNDYVKYNKNIRVMANFHDDDLWPKWNDDDDNEPIRIGWGGSLGHATTWQKTMLVEAMRVLKRKYQNKIEYIICGKIPDAIANSDIPCGFVGQWTPFDKWSRVVRSFKIDMAPLAGAYDRRRSGLKIIEYGLAERPAVGSDEGEYPLCEPDGIILVKDKVELWVEAFSRLIEDRDYRHDMGRRARAWAENYLMSRHVEDYEDVLFS